MFLDLNMKKFLDKDFILETPTAKKLFHNFAEKMPIFDFHNHLSAKEIYENQTLGNLANAWLDHDHYKWRAMRAFGVSEELITGHLNLDGSVNDLGIDHDYKRFLAFVKTLQNCIGNPLYHWSHLELQRYFGIKDPLTTENAKEVWDKCNALLAQKDFFVQGLLKKQNVKTLCTTDDPIDSLEYHKKLKEENCPIEVRPSFRPDNIYAISNKDFSAYVEKLANVSGVEINNIDDLLKSLEIRLDYFITCGCLVTDSSLENDFYVESCRDCANEVFKKALKKSEISAEEELKYKSYMLTQLGLLYGKKNLVMQIHIGALRDNSKVLLARRGKNVGNDSLADFNFAPQLSALLSKIEESGTLPKTILYNLNPKDNETLATMCGNFNSLYNSSDSETGFAKVQFGPAWWFNDHKDGIAEQIRVFARTSVLGGFVGMLTDSRSYLSFPRHEYFRRILCNFIGGLVENGEYPNDMKTLGAMVEKISYYNAEKIMKN